MENRISRIKEWKKVFSLRVSRSFLQSPTRISILGFAGLITVGTILLMLPESSATKGLGFINALFTATSASCVTGLVVVDTGHALSRFGQIVTLVLIQVGGLGIMVMSTIVLMVAGRRPSLAARLVIRDSLTLGGERSPFSILRDVVLFTFVIEGVGTALMFIRFLQEREVTDALYLSLFHAVSAFCNAGFSLFPDNFQAYQGDWLLNTVACLLIISGGIGFLVLSEIKRQFPFNRRTWSRFSLHTKLVLFSTAVLLIFSSLLIILMEWHDTLAHLPVTDRYLAGFFQAVTARTAGFNTLPIGNMANETLFLLILLMFIGASPGSCGGGIKTTTLATIFTLGFSRLRGKSYPQLFHRTVSEDSVAKAASILMISLFVVVLATLMLLMTELGEIPHPLSRGKFLELFFEVVSAFGTVGLSMGLTPILSGAGKLIISAVMFVGRLGPLVIALAVSRRDSPRFRYAEENIMIG